MTESASAELQKFVLDALLSAASIQALVGNRVFDDVNADDLAPFIRFGPSDYVPEDDAPPDVTGAITGREEFLQLDIFSESFGQKIECKRIADACKTVLHGLRGDMGSNALALLKVGRVRIVDDPDDVTVHGIVPLSAEIEELTA